MIYTVTVLTPTTSFAMTYSTLESADKYACNVMSASSDPTEVLILRTNNGVAKVVTRYHRDNTQQPCTPTKSQPMLYSLTVLTASDEARVVTFPKLRDATMYATVIMNSGCDATEVLILCLTEGASTLVKRYRRDNV
jgi:hypothetical protein